MSQYPSILSFLRVLRSAVKAQPPKLGFFVTTRKIDVSVVSALVSIAAILGPFSYGVLAIYEMGRLSYFNAPVEFIQLTSFGFSDVIGTVWPMLIPIIAVIALSMRITWMQGIHRVYAVVNTVALVAILMIGVVTNSYWKLGWMVVAFAAAGFMLLKNMPLPPDIGNEIEPEPGPQETRDQTFWRRARKAPFVAVAIMFLGWMIWAYGSKDSETQSYYWVTTDEVILGFYGDKALTSKLVESTVGRSFSIRDVKDLREISYQKVGPLKASLLWRPEPGM